MQIVKARVLHDYGWIVRFWLDDGSHVDKIVDGYPTWIGPDGNVVDLCPDAVLRGGIGRGRLMRFAIVGPAGTLISGRGVRSL